MWIDEIIMKELRKVVEPLSINVVELFIKENKKGLTINVVITKEDGVTIDDCEKVTRLLNDRLSILDELEVSNYRLQVSSPGLFRVFKSEDEYNIFKSRAVKIILKEPLGRDDKTIHEGILKGIEDDLVKIEEVDGNLTEIPVNKIGKTKLNG